MYGAWQNRRPADSLFGKPGRTEIRGFWQPPSPLPAGPFCHGSADPCTADLSVARFTMRSTGSRSPSMMLRS